LHRPTSGMPNFLMLSAEPDSSVKSLGCSASARTPFLQGLTLVNCSAQLERFIFVTRVHFLA